MTDPTTIALEAKTSELAKLRAENEKLRSTIRGLRENLSDLLGIEHGASLADAIVALIAERIRLRGRVESLGLALITSLGWWWCAQTDSTIAERERLRELAEQVLEEVRRG